MITRMEIFIEKFDEYASLAGSGKAHYAVDNIANKMLGITEQCIEEIPYIVNTIASLNDDQFEELIEWLAEAAANEKQARAKLARDYMKNRQEIEEYLQSEIFEEEQKRLEMDAREYVLLFSKRLPMRHAQVIARREFGMSDEEIMDELNISLKEVKDAYSKGMKRLAALQNNLQ